MKIGITFASVGDEYEKDPVNALDEIKNAGYEVFEVARHDKFADGELAKALAARGLVPVAGHFCWPDFEDDMYEGTLAYAGTFGIDTLVIPWCYPETIKDYASTVETAKKLDALAAKVKGRGYKLAYHNHWMEFADVYEGKYILDIFLENTSLVGFELDIGWAYTGGLVDVPAYIRKLGKRCPLLHIKDVKDMEKTPVEIGTGLLDIKACLDAGNEIGVPYGIVEQDSPMESKAYPPFESIRVSRENLRKMGY